MHLNWVWRRVGLSRRMLHVRTVAKAAADTQEKAPKKNNNNNNNNQGKGGKGGKGGGAKQTDGFITPRAEDYSKYDTLSKRTLCSRSTPIGKSQLSPRPPLGVTRILLPRWLLLHVVTRLLALGFESRGGERCAPRPNSHTWGRPSVSDAGGTWT
jgi:hypothetical protein